MSDTLDKPKVSSSSPRTHPTQNKSNNKRDLRARKNHQSGGWEMSASDALRVNYLVSELNIDNKPPAEKE